MRIISSRLICIGVFELWGIVVIFKKFKNIVTEYGRALVDFMFPPFCMLCEESLLPSEKNVCDSCWHLLPLTEPPFLESDLQSQSAKFEKFYVGSLAVWQYTELAQEIVHLLKYNGYQSLAKRIGSQMGHLASEYEDYKYADFIVPIPLHKIRHREREFNQSQLLANYVSNFIQVPVNEKMLVRNRYTNPQAKLSATERHKNIIGAFSIKDNTSLKDTHIIVIDDVITTGSTINECAGILKNAGAKSVYALTAFRA